MTWILLLSFAIGQSTRAEAKPPAKATPTQAEQILNRPPKTSLAGVGPLLPQIRTTLERQDSFVRGEFDRPEVQEKIALEINQSLTFLAGLKSAEIPAWLVSDGDIWWLFLERLSYDEVTKPALDFSWKHRRAILQAISSKMAAVDFPAGRILPWLKQLDFKTPIDRLILAEARNQQVDGTRLIHRIQRNSKQSIRQIRETLPSKQKSDLAVLDPLWTDEDAKNLREIAELCQRMISKASAPPAR